jgi:nucleotide-binding universal stress UspA family protein
MAAEFTRAARLEHEHAMTRLVAPWRDRGLAIEQVVVEGEPGFEIEAAAKAQRSDLIVMGTHGRHGFERLLLGSVTEKVLRRAPCPVLTLRQDSAGEGLFFRRVLCAVDLLEDSPHTLGLASAFAGDVGARLGLLHVIEGLPAAGAGLGLPETGAFRAELKATASEQLSRLAASVGGPAQVEQRVEFGVAWRSIVAEARRTNADLIVVGAHTRSLAARLFLGATANHVVRDADCPVLVVRDAARLARARGLLSERAAS